jgi:hypothetical protein
LPDCEALDADFRFRELNPMARQSFAVVPDPIGSDFIDAIHRLWQIYETVALLC